MIEHQKNISKTPRDLGRPCCGISLEREFFCVWCDCFASRRWVCENPPPHAQVIVYCPPPGPKIETSKSGWGGQPPAQFLNMGVTLPKSQANLDNYIIHKIHICVYIIVYVYLIRAARAGPPRGSSDITVMTQALSFREDSTHARFQERYVAR